MTTGVQYVDPADHADSDCGKQIDYQTKASAEAEVLVTVISCGPCQLPGDDILGKLILTLLRQQGDVVAYEFEGKTTDSVIFRAEFCNVSVVDKALAAVRESEFGVSHIPTNSCYMC